MLTDIKYRYALDDGCVVNIGSESVIRGKEYLCLSCGAVLIPVLGDFRQKHFRHKVQADCSSETYVHNLAKRMFFQTYSECLTDHRPYHFEYRVPTKCNACKNHGPCQVGHTLKKTDLTRHFKNISLETRDGNFIPDILLKNEAGTESLYVEIAVTHFIEENKTNSGVRIIEINVNDESDIELITSGCISEDDSRISTRNFQTVPVTANYAKECMKTTPCFVLYPSGKSIAGDIPIWKYEYLVDKGTHVEKIQHTDAETFVSKVSELHIKGLKIKNCWLCKFHCLNYQTIDSFCRLRKESIENTNCAVDCDKYKPLTKIPECGLIQDAENRLQTSRVNSRATYSKTTFPLHPITSDKSSNSSDTTLSTSSVYYIKPTYSASLPHQKTTPNLFNVIFYGYSMSCTKCGSEVYFVTSASFGELHSFHFITEDGRYYKRSMAIKLIKEIADDGSLLSNLGILVRHHGEYAIQCSMCSEVNSMANSAPKKLLQGTISHKTYQKIFRI